MDLAIGIAAGMIKHAAHITPGLVGVASSITFGSYTLELCEGNKKPPQYWFDEEFGMSLNAIQLTNDGWQAFLDIELPQIAECLEDTGTALRVNIAPTGPGTLRQMCEQLERCPDKVYIDELELSPACPNYLTGSEHHPILAYDVVAVAELLKESESYTGKKALKVAPKSGTELLEEIVSLCAAHGIFTIVSGNALAHSSWVVGLQRLSVESGGMGGRPLFPFAIKQFRELVRICNARPEQFQLRGCGGVMDAEAAREYFDAGADEVLIATLYQEFPKTGLRDLLIAL